MGTSKFRWAPRAHCVTKMYVREGRSSYIQGFYRRQEDNKYFCLLFTNPYESEDCARFVVDTEEEARSQLKAMYIACDAFRCH